MVILQNTRVRHYYRVRTEAPKTKQNNKKTLDLDFHCFRYKISNQVASKLCYFFLRKTFSEPPFQLFFLIRLSNGFLKLVSLKFTQVSWQNNHCLVHYIDNKHVPQSLKTRKCPGLYFQFISVPVCILQQTTLILLLCVLGIYIFKINATCFEILYNVNTDCSKV